MRMETAVFRGSPSRNTVGSKHSTFKPTAKFLPTEIHFTVCFLLACSLVLCMPPYEAAMACSNPATVLAVSVQQPYTLTS